MKILVVGCTGNLGTKITTELLKTNHEIYLLVRPISISKPDVQEFQQNGAKIIKGDTFETENLEKSLEKVDIVISATRDIQVETNLFKSIQKLTNIQLYIPSFWIPDPKNLKKGENMEWDTKIDLLKDIQTSKIPHTFLFCGFFLDSPTFLGIDLIQEMIQIFGDGNQKIPVIHSNDVAKLVPMIIENKDFLYKSLHLISDYYSTNQVLDWVDKQGKITKLNISENDLEEIISFYTLCNNLNALKNLHWQKNIFFSEKLNFESDLKEFNIKFKTAKDYFEDYLQGKETLFTE